MLVIVDIHHHLILWHPGPFRFFLVVWLGHSGVCTFVCMYACLFCECVKMAEYDCLSKCKAYLSINIYLIDRYCRIVSYVLCKK